MLRRSGCESIDDRASVAELHQLKMACSQQCRPKTANLATITIPAQHPVRLSERRSNAIGKVVTGRRRLLLEAVGRAFTKVPAS